MTDPIAALLGEWSQCLNVWSIIFRISLAVIISTIIGCERSSKRHSAGLRTFIIVTCATTVAMITDIFLEINYDTSFFFISCISVISVAVISVQSLYVSSRRQIKGLTTSVSLWLCGIIGLTAGAGFYTVTLVSSLVLYLSLSVLPKAESYLKNRSNHFEIHLELKSCNYLQNFVSTIRRLGLKIDDIESNSAYADSGLSVYSIAISISSKELKKYKTHTEIIEALKTLDYIYHIEEMLP